MEGFTIETKQVFNNLKTLENPFRSLYFSFDRPKKVRNNDKDYWITPTGHCKIWVGSLHLEDLGNIDESVENQLVQYLMSNKCDVVTDGRFYYTRAQSGLSRIKNFKEIFNKAVLVFYQRFPNGI